MTAAKLLAALDQAIAAASTVTESTSLLAPLSAGALIAVQVPLKEWTAARLCRAESREGDRMTDRDLAQAAWHELTLSTDSYPTWVKKGKPATSHWAKAKASLDQIGVTPPPPPPPPPPTTVGKLFHRTASNGTVDPHADQHPERWTWVDMQGRWGPQYAPALEAAGVDAYIYKNGLQIGYGNDTYNGSDIRAVYAVGPNEATPEMKTNLAWNHGTLAAVGNPAYQDLFFNNTVKALETSRCTGVFIDDVHAWLTDGYPTVYPTEATFQQATLSFLEYIYPRFKALGIPVVCNVGPSPSATKFIPIRDEWLSHMDGVMDETVGGYVENTPSKGAWVPNLLGLIGACQRLGKLFLGEVLATDDNITHQIYGISQVLLAKDYGSDLATAGVRGKTETDGSHYGHEVWTPVHYKAISLGQPTGPFTTSGGVFTRQFEHGTVRVDSVAGTATIT